MKTIKGLILGSTAALMAVGSAQAADLPVKAKAVEYVRVCSLYGAGFYYIPGTDTCIKIGGYVRADASFNSAVYEVPFFAGGAGANGSYNKDYYATRERANLNMDTRTATEYGVVRTFTNVQMQFSQNVDNIAGGNFEMDFAFVQFAGFTFGKAVSQFDPQWTLSRPTISSGHFGGSFNATGIPQLAYTASFGNGVSGTISLENSQAYRQAGVYNTAGFIQGPGGATFNASGALLAGNYGVNSNTWLGNSTGGQHIPDIVGNIRLDQAWGSLHFAAAGHQVTSGYYTGSTLQHPDDRYGFAVSGAIELKNLPTGAGDSLKLEASYAKGAAKYIFGGTVDTTGAGRFAAFSDNSVGFGYVLDGIYSSNTGFSGQSQTQLSNAWEVTGYFEHYWNPAWRTSLWGNYAHIDYGDAGNAMLLAAFGVGGRLGQTAASTAGIPGQQIGAIAGTTGDFSLNIAQIGTRTAWTPVQNLTLSAEFTYSRLDQNLGGTYTYTGTAAGLTTNQVYQIRDQNIYNGSVQILRSF